MTGSLQAVGALLSSVPHPCVAFVCIKSVAMACAPIWQVWGVAVPELPVAQRVDAYQQGLRMMGASIASSDPNRCLNR